MNKGLTLTIVFKANSLNYGEGIANVSELKKMHRGNGQVFTFASRQSLRYDIVRLGNELYNWNLQTVDKKKGTVQFREDVTIADSTEMDLFGYLKTGKNSEKRPAVARLSHAISLEPYRSDMEFLNNMGLAERIPDTPNLANIEQHDSLYTYTLTVDLNRIGKDGDLELSNDEKSERVIQLLEIVKILNRHIRGRQENLSPIFAIGGLYPTANPFFLGKVQLIQGTKDWCLNTNVLRDTLELSVGQGIKELTSIGYVKGLFANDNDFAELVGDRATNVERFFKRLKDDVQEYYGAVQA